MRDFVRIEDKEGGRVASTTYDTLHIGSCKVSVSLIRELRMCCAEKVYVREYALYISGPLPWSSARFHVRDFPPDGASSRQRELRKLIGSLHASTGRTL